MEPEKVFSVYAEASIQVICKAILQDGPKAAKRIWRYFRSGVELRGDRAELLHELFLANGRFLFSPGTDWRPAPGQDAPPRFTSGYPHEIEALTAFVPLLPENSLLTDSLFFEDKVTPVTHIVCTGSPKANSLTRRYLPSLGLGQKDVRQQYETFISYRNLPYVFGEDLVGPRVEVISKMHPGETKAKTRKFIWRNDADKLKPWQPPGYVHGARLQKDFLLISRLPRNKVGGDILMFAGAHGAGTEAVRLIFQKLGIRQLRELLDTLDGARYYQFVVEVTEVEHTARGTIPKKIRLCGDLPPVNLDDRAKVREELRKDL